MDDARTASDPGTIRAVVFDVDGTLVEHRDDKTVWQLLNERFIQDPGLNRERLESFRAGRITYAEWVALDISDWVVRGVRRAEIEDIIRAELTVTPGAVETIAALRRRGLRVAVVSGTLDITLRTLLDGLPLDRCFTNRIYFHRDGRIRGWRATPYDSGGKARAIERLAAEFGIGCAQCAFVGDHWNDLAALARAGFAIAYRPKDDAVRQAADVVLEQAPLTAMLELFGGG